MAHTDPCSCHPQISSRLPWSPGVGTGRGRGELESPNMHQPRQRGNRGTEHRAGGSTEHLCKGIPKHIGAAAVPQLLGVLCVPQFLWMLLRWLWGTLRQVVRGPQCPSCVGTLSPAGGRARGGTRFPLAAGGNGAGRAWPGPRSAGTWLRHRGLQQAGGTGGPRELTQVQGDSSWSPQGRPARSPAGRPKGAAWGL